MFCVKSVKNAKGNFFLHRHVCGVCDKYEVCPNSTLCSLCPYLSCRGSIKKKETSHSGVTLLAPYRHKKVRRRQGMGIARLEPELIVKLVQSPEEVVY